jgi:hypothetical protein
MLYYLNCCNCEISGLLTDAISVISVAVKHLYRNRNHRSGAASRYGSGSTNMMRRRHPQHCFDPGFSDHGSSYFEYGLLFANIFAYENQM